MFDKIMSGRFIFTVIAAFVFAYLACTSRLTSDKVMEVILIVIYAYFQRSDRKSENGGQKNV